MRLLCRRPRIANGCRAAVKESLILNRDVTPFSYREVDMVQYWWFYVVVGLVLGMNVGYMFGIKRGADIVGSLVAGVMDGINKAVTGEVGKSGPASGGD